MTGGQENATGGLADADKVAGGGGTQDAILTDEKLLDTISGTDLSNLLDDIGIVVAAVTADDQEGIGGALGDGLEDGGDERLGVVGLLEDLDLFAKAGAVAVSSCLMGEEKT